MVQERTEILFSFHTEYSRASSWTTQAVCMLDCV